MVRRFGVVVACVAGLLLAAESPAAAQTLTLTKTELGTVASDPAGIDCGEGCRNQSATFPRKADPDCEPELGPCPLLPQEVTLTAVPARPGVEFQGWSGDCSGTAPECVVSMTTNRSVHAHFADVEAPTVTLTGPDPGPYRGGTVVTAQATASDNVEVDFVGFDFKQKWLGFDTSAPYSMTFSVGNTSGTFSVYAAANDISGRWSAVVERKITVDADPPVVTIDAAPAWSNGGAEQIGFTVEGAAGAPACSFNGSAFAACTGASSHTVQVPDDATGPQTLSVRAVDAVGNETVRDVVFQVDRTPPTLTFGVMPSHTNAASAVFPFAVDGTGSSATVVCRRDGGPPEPCTSTSEFAWHDLADGLRTLTVVVSDQAGNVAEFSRTLLVDRSPPQASIVGGPSDGARLTAPATATYELAVSEAGAALACRIYPQGTTAPAFGACSGPGARHTAAGLGVGTYVFEVQATDAMGNAGVVTSRALAVEPPAILAPRIGAKVSAGWRATRRHTMVRRLTLSGILQGATVEAICKGKRRSCPFKRKSFAVDSGAASLTRAFRGRRLLPGTVLELRVLKPGAVGQVIRFTVHRGAKPSVALLCMPLGAIAPAGC